MGKKYKIIEIRLTPVTPYFFGKENWGELGNKYDYFQTSQEYPQQTTLLGFLRHKILRDNGIDLDKDNFRNTLDQKPEDLVGIKGFEPGEYKADKFGKVLSISPCFIADNNNNYLWERCHEYVKNGNRTEELCLDEENKILKWHDSIKNTDIKYLAKHPYYENLNNIEKDKIFHTNAKPGNFKGGTKPKLTDDSYFIMKYRNISKNEEICKSNTMKFQKKENLSFGFLACIDQDAPINTTDDFMPMGKDRSIFKVETSVIKENIALHEHKHEKFYDFKPDLKIGDDEDSEYLKCVLLSDAMAVDDDHKKLNQLCLLQITGLQRMRFITRETKKFYPGARPVKSSKAYNLISRSSVLFLKKEKKDEVQEIFDNAADFKQIGYNYIFFTSAKTM